MNVKLLILGAAMASPAALLLSVPVAAQTADADMAKYLADGPAVYKGKINVADNGATRILVSSQAAWQSPDSDMYLAATIDKNTKQARYFTYQAEIVSGEWADYSKAQLATPSGPVDVKVSFKEPTVVGCAEQCTLREFVAFPVDRAMLDAFAGRSPPSDKLTWQLISSKGRGNATGTLSIGEIKAFLAEVDTQLKKK